MSHEHVSNVDLAVEGSPGILHERPLTKFPNLFLERTPRNDEILSHRAFAGSLLPPELLTLAWASVLGGYAGSADVLFRINDNTVCVNTKTGHVLKVPYETARDREPSTTTIITEEDEPGDSSHLDSLVSASNGSNDKSEALSKHGNPSILAGRAPFLRLNYFASSGQLTLHSRGLLPPQHLEELCRQVLSGISRRTQREVQSPGAEKHDPRLSIINAEPQLLPGPRLLHELLAPHRDSKTCALQYLESGGQIHSFKYIDIFSHAKLLAGKLVRKLHERSVVTSRLVIPVLLPQCPELYIALLAILQIGAAFCPLGTDMPHERIKFIVGDVDAPLLVTSEKNMILLPGSFKLDVCLVDVASQHGADLQHAQGPDEQAQYTFRQPSPSDTAYVMYSKHFMRCWRPIIS